MNKVGLTMSHLERCFMSALEQEAKFVVIVVEMDGFPKKELIINQMENILPKLEYYKTVYDENLNHKFSKGIRIFGCTYGDSLQEIEEQIL